MALVPLVHSSSGLAAAYGLAVTATMVITTILIYYVARDFWKWRPWLALQVSGVLLLVDLSFFLANFDKLFKGGFVLLIIALFIFTSMTAWRRGRYILGQRLKQKALPVNSFIEQLVAVTLHRVPRAPAYLWPALKVIRKATDFFKLPVDQVFEISIVVEL